MSGVYDLSLSGRLIDQRLVLLRLVRPAVEADQQVARVFLGAGRTAGDQYVFAGDVEESPKPVAGELLRVLVGYLGSPAINRVAACVEPFAREVPEVPFPEHCQIPAAASRCMKPQRGFRSTEANSCGVGDAVAVAVGPDEAFGVLRPTLAPTGAPDGRAAHVAAGRGDAALAELVDLQVPGALAAAEEEKPAIDPPHAIDEAVGGTVAFRHAVIATGT